MCKIFKTEIQNAVDNLVAECERAYDNVAAECKTTTALRAEVEQWKKTANYMADDALGMQSALKQIAEDFGYTGEDAAEMASLAREALMQSGRSKEKATRQTG